MSVEKCHFMKSKKNMKRRILQAYSLIHSIKKDKFSVFGKFNLVKSGWGVIPFRDSLGKKSCMSIMMIIIIYHMCRRFIPLHSCDYLNKISIKINVATDEGIGQNEV